MGRHLQSGQKIAIDVLALAFRFAAARTLLGTAIQHRIVFSVGR
jgi:hypothetical protein